MKDIYHVVDHLICDPGINPDPEGITHRLVSVGEVSDDAVWDVDVTRLPQNVAGEEHSRGDLVLIEPTNEGRALGALDGQREAEPARLRVWRRLRHDQEIEVSQPVEEAVEVALPPLDERRQLLELRDADSGLHVGRLEVVADARVNVLVVVARRKITVLLVKPFAAGVVLPRRAPAVSPPIAERLDDLLEG